MKLFVQRVFKASVAIMCEDLAEVYSRRKEWGEAPLALCTKAAVIWDALAEHDKNHVMDQAKSDMYNIDDEAVKHT